MSAAVLLGLLALGALLACLIVFAHGLVARRQITRLKRVSVAHASQKSQEDSR